jgi:uncharacterized membrane protein YvbJ
VALRCDNCDQSILPTDTVCWYCGKEITPQQTMVVEAPEMDKSTPSNEETPISLTAVSVFVLITLFTIILFIIVTDILASYSGG